MPDILNRRIQRLRGGIAAKRYVNDAPLSENLGDRQATIVLLELSGLDYRSSKGENSSDAKKMGLSRRLRRSSRKHGISHAVVEIEDDSAAATPTPAKVVVWCQQNESKSSSESIRKHVSSCPMSEESMDDEGNVLSWSCRWPDETISLGIPLPSAYERKKNSVITLGVGLKHTDQSEIQPLGVATVSIPGEEEAILDLSIPVKPMKQKTRLFGEFGAKRSLPKDCEYIISPLTVLNVNLRVTSKETSAQPIFGTLVDGTANSEYPSLSYPDVTKIDQGSLADSVETEKSSTASQVSVAQLLRMNFSSTEFNRGAVSVEGSKTSKTVKAANFSAPSDASDVFAIESVDSVLEGNLAKPRNIVTVHDGEKLTEMKTQLADVSIHPSGYENPVDESVTEEAPLVMVAMQEKQGGIQDDEVSMEEGKSIMENDVKNDQVEEQCYLKQPGQQGQAQIYDTLDHKPLSIMAFVELERNNSDENDVKNDQVEGQWGQAQTYDTLDHKPLSIMAFVELKRDNSDALDVGEDLTVGSFEETPIVEVSQSLKDKKQQKQNHRGYERLKRLTRIEVNSCVSTLEEVIDDAVAGFSDILTCGLFLDEIVDDDMTCRTDRTSLKTHESTIRSSYGPTVCQPDSVSDTLDSILTEVGNDSRCGGAAEELSRALGQSNTIHGQKKYEKFNDSRSTRSEPRRPTPAEMKLLGSSYKCDES
eukprot:CAMPEP_0172330098 /NCGR_PEP_ID=MMETSP1058-20130122/61224_1 /TAXON_ID=83371 /ORGANISM="Detonula confervacea, Strain CCMP 353" /LENGTH=704 /DNA_ID=CAMNT_0013047299 /DNA_START=73 /DNA_END=2184 /DNA_ORIENTATION=+